MKEFDNTSVFIGYNLQGAFATALGQFARLVANTCEECNAPQSEADAYLAAVALDDAHRAYEGLEPKYAERFRQLWNLECRAILDPRTYPPAVLELQILHKGNLMHKTYVAFDLPASCDSKWLNTPLSNYEPFGPVDPARLNKQ